MELRDRKHEDAPLEAEHSAGAARAPAGLSKRTERRVDRGSSPRRIASLRVGALGASAWVVSVGVPIGEGGIHSPADVVLAVLPLLALALGLRFFLRDRAEATPLLAIAVPALLATAVAGRADPALSDRYATPLVILSGLAMLGYVIAAAHALARPSVLRETRVSKLAVTPDASRPGLRALVLGTMAVSAVILTIVAPALGSHASYAASWGEAADEGRVLVAILAAAIATLASAVILAPALRARRSGEVRAGGDGVAVAASLVVAVTGAMAWAILQFVER
jgi:hypothetical protein